LNIARSAGQKAGQKAIDFSSSKLTPKSQQILSKLVSSTPAYTSRSNTTEGTAGDTKFEQLDSWVRAARDQNTTPYQTIA